MTKVKDTSFNALNRLNVTRQAPPPKNAALAKKLEAKVADQFSRGVQAQKVATYNARGLVVQKPVLTIRGGAWSKERITPELEKGTHIMLERAAQEEEARAASKLTPNLDPAVFEAIRNGVAVAEYLVKPQRNSGAKDFKLSQFVHQTAAAVEKTLASSPRYKGLDPASLKDEYVDQVRKHVYNVLETEAMAVKSGAKPTMTETTREILKKSVESPDAMREMLANPDNWVFGEGYAATTILQTSAKAVSEAQSVTTSVYDTTQKISTLDGNTGAIRGYSLKQKEGSFILAVG